MLALALAVLPVPAFAAAKTAAVRVPTEAVPEEDAAGRRGTAAAPADPAVAAAVSVVTQEVTTAGSCSSLGLSGLGGKMKISPNIGPHSSCSCCLSPAMHVKTMPLVESSIAFSV